MTIIAKMTADQVKAQIVEVAAHENRTRELLTPVFFDVTAHAVQHGDITLTNKLIEALTSANKVMLIRLVQTTTEFAYSKKEKAFTGKDKTLTAEDKAERAAALSFYVNECEGDVFKWNDAVNADKDTQPKFNKAALIRMLGLFLKEEQAKEEKAAQDEGREVVEVTFDGAVSGLVEEVKADTLKAMQAAEVIELRTNKLIEVAGLDKKDALAQATKEYKANRLSSTGEIIRAAA